MSRSDDRHILSLLCIGLAVSGFGCSAVCESTECETRIGVAKSISFAADQSEGVSVGFNIDGRISGDSDVQTCGHADRVAPDGTPGIDNNFSAVWTALSGPTGEAVEGLIHGAINDGTLLMMVSLEGIDSYDHDDCVEVRVFSGAGKPDIGTDGLLNSGQTFDLKKDAPVNYVGCGTMRDGVVTAGPFDGYLPIQILDVQLDLAVFGALVRVEISSDEEMSVMIGAGVSAEQVIEVAQNEPMFADLAKILVRNLADLAPNEQNECEQLSATIIVDGVSAFLFDELP